MRRSKGEAKQAKWQGEQGSAVEKKIQVSAVFSMS